MQTNSDYLHGAKAIGEHIGASPRRVFYLAERGLIPVGKIGSILVGRKSRLDEHFARLEAEHELQDEEAA